MSLVTISAGILTQGNNDPFEIGGAVYQILLSADTGNFECFKSTDQGATWNQAGVGVVTSASTFAVCTDGSKLFLSYIDDVSQFQAMQVFDTATDSWTTNHISTIGSSGGTGQFTCYRAIDNVVIVGILATDLIPVPNRGRCGYYKYNIVADTFSALVPYGETNPAVTESWAAYGVFPGNGCVHFLILVLDNDGLGGGSTMRQQALSDVDVLGPIQTIDSQPANYPSILPSGVCDGTNLYVGWGPVDFPNNSVLKVFIGPSSAGAPVVFATQTIDTGLPNTFFQWAPLLIAGVYYALMVTNDGGADYKLWQYTDTGTGFDAGVLLLTNPAFIFCRWGNSVSFQTFALIVEGSVMWLAMAPAPPPPAPAVGTLRLQYPLPASLPDPRFHCSKAQQKRCVTVDGRNIQMTKGVTGINTQ